jgi:TonB family protein
MKNAPSILSFVVISAVGLSFQVLGAPEPDADKPLQIIQTRHPIYPASLNRIGITNGFAAIAFSVDAEGKLVDYLPIAYTHEEFFRSSVAALTRWQFEPARAAGQPRAVVSQMTFNYESSGNVVEMTVGDDIHAQYNRMRPTVEVFRVSKLNELDQIPVPVNIVRPGYPEAFLGSDLEGAATIEFYIDESGDVRLPVVIDQSASEFAGAAIQAVRQWKFEPPMKDGKPVSAIAKQRFHFKPSSEE